MGKVNQRHIRQNLNFTVQRQKYETKVQVTKHEIKYFFIESIFDKKKKTFTIHAYIFLY